MLVLSRSNNESLTVTTSSGEVIEFRILDNRKSLAKVGVKAPLNCKIVRNELLGKGAG